MFFQLSCPLSVEGDPCMSTPGLPQVLEKVARPETREPTGGRKCLLGGLRQGWGTNSFCSFAALPGSPVISLTPVPLLMLPRTTPTPSSPLSPHTPCFCSLSQPHPGSALGPGACQHVVSPGCPPPPCSLPWREPLLC